MIQGVLSESMTTNVLETASRAGVGRSRDREQKDGKEEEIDVLLMQSSPFFFAPKRGHLQFISFFPPPSITPQAHVLFHHASRTSSPCPYRPFSFSHILVPFVFFPLQTDVFLPPFFPQSEYSSSFLFHNLNIDTEANCKA